MREILFKAKRIDNGEWVEGGYAYVFDKDIFAHILGKITEKHCIVEESGNFVIVDKTTICQYTGLTDKNGNKIWENDILKCGSNLLVTWSKELASYCLDKKGWLHSHFFGECCDSCETEVIGNCFDNPELMERKE